MLLFLDGDTLAEPGTVAAHRAAHQRRPDAVGRGETWHLRCTRILADPERLVAWPDQAERFATMPSAERERMGVTRDQVRHDFDAITKRSAPGIYPGAGPRRLHEVELAALRGDPANPFLWAAASGSNLSVPRAAFLAAGGFDAALDINEHRELALRLMQNGLTMMPVEGARTHHLTHRTGWRDPLVERGWEAVFRRRHPRIKVEILANFWRDLAMEGESGPQSFAALGQQRAMSEPIPLGARITPAERPVMIAAAEQLSECLTDPGEPGWPVTLRFVGDGEPAPAMMIATLRGAMDEVEDADQLRVRLAALRDAGTGAIFLCTLLRHVAEPSARAALMPRIRRLNLLAIELSHDLGIAVIDVDRILALFGAGPLRTDYRLGGIAAPEVTAHAIVSALLAEGLDEWVAIDRQQRAIARHGDIHNIAAIVDRRVNGKAGRMTG